MLSYIIILLGSLVVLLAVTFIFKAICLVFKAVSNFIKPVSGAQERVTIRCESAVRQKKSNLSNAVHDALEPLNRRNQKTAWNRAKTHPVDPDFHPIQDFGWLQRERKSVLREDSYRIRRRVTAAEPTLEMVSRPFKREVAPWVLEYRASKKR